MQSTIERPAPVCAGCGNDGTRASLYLTIDAKWRPDLGAWELEQRLDSGGQELDCLECDHRTPEDEEHETGFPYGYCVRSLNMVGETIAPPDPAIQSLIEALAQAVARSRMVADMDKSQARAVAKLAALRLVATDLGATAHNLRPEIPADYFTRAAFFTR